MTLEGAEIGGHCDFLVSGSDLTRTRRETPNSGGVLEPHPVPGPYETNCMVSVRSFQLLWIRKNESGSPI